MATTTEQQGTGTSGTTRATIGILVVLALLAVVAYLSGDPSQRVGPAAADLPAERTAVALPLESAATSNLRIPSIGVDTRQLSELGQTEDCRLEVPRDATTVGPTPAARPPASAARRSTPRT